MYYLIMMQNVRTMTHCTTVSHHCDTAAVVRFVWQMLSPGRVRARHACIDFAAPNTPAGSRIGVTASGVDRNVWQPHQMNLGVFIDGWCELCRAPRLVLRWEVCVTISINGA